MHTVHAEIHTEGLQDNCPACEDHANNPFASLDAEMLSNLVALTLDMRLCPEKKKFPRTENEAIARAQVMNVLEKSGRMMEIMQLCGRLDLIKLYYQNCWRIDI